MAAKTKIGLGARLLPALQRSLPATSVPGARGHAVDAPGVRIETPLPVPAFAPTPHLPALPPAPANEIAVATYDISAKDSSVG